MELLDSGRAPEAYDFFLGSIDVDPAQSVVHYNAGIALKELNRLPESLSRYKTARPPRNEKAMPNDDHHFPLVYRIDWGQYGLPCNRHCYSFP